MLRFLTLLQVRIQSTKSLVKTVDSLLFHAAKQAVTLTRGLLYTGELTTDVGNRCK